MYTGVQRGHNEEGFIQDVQTQCVAFGDGVDYEKYEANPVLTKADLPEGGSAVDFSQDFPTVTTTPTQSC